MDIKEERVAKRKLSPAKSSTALELLALSTESAATILERSEVKDLAAQNPVAAAAFAELSFCFRLVGRAREVILTDASASKWKPLDARFPDDLLAAVCTKYSELQRGFSLGELQELFPDRHQMTIWKAIKALRSSGLILDRNAAKQRGFLGYVPTDLGLKEWSAGHKSDSRPQAASNGTA